MPLLLSASQLGNARISPEELRVQLASAFGADVDFGNSVFIVNENSVGSDVYGNAPLLSNARVDFATMMANFSASRDKVSAEQLAMDCAQIQDYADTSIAIENKVSASSTEALERQKEVEERQGKQRVITLLEAAFVLICTAVVTAVTVLGSVLTGPAAIFVGSVAVLGMVMAAMDMINEAVQLSGKQVPGANGEMKNLDVSLSGMVAAATERMVASGILTFDSDEDKQAWISNWSMGVNGMVMALTLAGGAVTALTMRGLIKAAEEGCPKAIEALEKASRSGAFSILNMANGIDLVCQASTTAATACNTKRIGESQYELSCAEADRDFFRQLRQVVSEQSDAVLQQLLRVIQGISEGRNQVAELIALFGRVNPALEAH